MNDFIISILTATDLLYDIVDIDGNVDNPSPQPRVFMAEYGNRRAYLYSGDETAWPDSYIVGAWDRQTGLQAGQSYDVDGATVIGTPTYPVHSDYTTFIRPLGNDNGVGTDNLDTTRWQGAPEEKFLEDADRYPSSNRPFTLRMTRTKIMDDGFSHIPWGWTAEILSTDPERVVTARAVGIYSDPEWVNYLYTTGAFSLDPITGLYTSVCPVGQRTAEPQPIYYSLLWGSLQEGNWQMTNLTEGHVENRLHWQFDQDNDAVVLKFQPAGVETNAVVESQYSPEGFEIIEIGTFGVSRVFLDLGGERDTADPTLVFYLPSGVETVGMTWSAARSRYQSGNEIGLRSKLLATVGERIRVEIRWL